MKWLLWSAGFVVVVGGAFFVFSFLAPKAHITNFPPHSGPIVAFGDSLVAGSGSTSGNDFVSDVSKLIGEPIINMGVSGNTSAQGLARVDEVIAKHPRMVLLLLGGNDYLQRVPRDTTIKNLGEIVDKLQEDGALVVILGVRGGVLQDNFSPLFTKLAKDKQTLLVPDVLADIYNNPKLKSDEIHPNDAGYLLISQKVYKVIAPYLK